MTKKITGIFNVIKEIEMDREGFRTWLIDKQGLKENTASSIVSRVGRIEKDYDLDDEYASDGLEGLLEIFENAVRNTKEGLVPDIDIEIDGDYFTGLSSLKRALSLYIECLKAMSICESKSGHKSIENQEQNTPISYEENSEVENKCRPFFIGDIKSFKKYIAAGYRNKVNIWAKPERDKQNGICEYCREKAELQSAHREGKEFKDIIIQILEKKYKIEDNMYKVDLVDFEKEFKEAHNTIRDVFFFLCPECHNKYDKSNEINTEQLINKRDDYE